jgi:hypothetical protein
MTFDFFEGAAGTGKTHNLVGRAGELVQGDALGDDHKLLPARARSDPERL